MCSIFGKAEIDGGQVTGRGVELSLLDNELERELIKLLGRFPELVKNAARLRAPHLVCDYLEQTAGAVNSWYHAGNPSRNPELAVLVDDADLRKARLALVRSVQIVLRNGLSILGIGAPQRMVREDDEITS
jgi:arginyl-tRNA synthetase